MVKYCFLRFKVRQSLTLKNEGTGQLKVTLRTPGRSTRGDGPKHRETSGLEVSQGLGSGGPDYWDTLEIKSGTG